MPSTSTLLVFALTTLAVLVVPGPSVVYVVTRTVQLGRPAGLLSMLGLETGALIHVVAAAAGLTALVASSEVAFNAVRYAGAAYLITLGVRQLAKRPALVTTGTAPAVPRGRLFRDGVMVDLLNPKTGLFFIAFLPQFVDTSAGRVSVQVAVLGLCFVVLAALCDSAYALAADLLSRRLQASRRTNRVIDRASAGVYMGLGGLAAIA